MFPIHFAQPSKPPLKLAIAAQLLERSPQSMEAITTRALSDYPGEKFVSPDAVETILHALRAVGIIQVVEAPQETSCSVWFAITKTGSVKVKKALGI